MNNWLFPALLPRKLVKCCLVILTLIGQLMSTLPTTAAGPSDLPSGVPHTADRMAFARVLIPGTRTEVITAEGRITQDTPRDFETFLKSLMENGGLGLDDDETVYLNSAGGDLIAGLELGEAIRAHKLATSVKTHCYSACAYAFLGGVKRSADAGDLGFHRFYSTGSVAKAIKQSDLDKTMSSAQQLMGLLVVYLKEMSIDPGLLFLASSADPSDLFQTRHGDAVENGNNQFAGNPSV